MFKKYLINFIVLAVVVALLLMVGVNTWCLKIFGDAGKVRGLFETNEILTAVTFSLFTSAGYISLYSLIVYGPLFIYALCLVIIVLLMLIRRRWGPLGYLIAMLIPTAILTFIGCLVYYSLIKIDSATNVIYVSKNVLDNLKSVLTFNQFKEVYEAQKAAEKIDYAIVAREVCLPLVYYIAAIVLVVGIFQYIGVCCRYIGKASKRKMYYPKYKNYTNQGAQVGMPVNYYYVSNYFDDKNSKATARDVKKGKKDEDLVYPKIKARA